MMLNCFSPLVHKPLKILRCSYRRKVCIKLLPVNCRFRTKQVTMRKKILGVGRGNLSHYTIIGISHPTVKM